MPSRSVVIFLFCILVAVGYCVALLLSEATLTWNDRIKSAGQLIVIPLLVGTCASLLASWLLQEERKQFINKVRAEMISEFDEDRKETQRIINEVMELLREGKITQATARQELIPRLHEADKNLSKTPTADEFLRGLGKSKLD